MDPLKAFEWWFCVALAFSLFYAALLALLLRRRDLWLRYTAAEAAFWLRIGCPARIVNACRRWEESGSFVYWIGGILAATVLIMAVGGVVYLKAKHLR